MHIILNILHNEQGYFKNVFYLNVIQVSQNWGNL